MSGNVIMGQLTLDKLSKYKSLNNDMLPELVDYYNKNKYKFNKQYNNGWKKTGNRNHLKHFEKRLVPLKPRRPKPTKSDDEKLYSEFRGILNKLTEQTFDNLSNDLVALEITTKDHLAKLADLIFQKGIIDIEFSLLYGKLSKKLAGYYIVDDFIEDGEEEKEKEKEKEEDDDKEIVDKKVYFRELLISECQITFNSCIMYDPKSKEDQKVVSKHKATGSMIFIGSLYNCDMLTNKIINSCFLLLLMKINAGNPNGYLVDCFSELMKTVGKIFTCRCVQETELIYQRIDLLIKSGKLDNRDRFALMDLVDLRKSGKWI